MILFCFILFLLQIAFWFFGREYEILFGVYGQTSIMRKSTFVIMTSILIPSSIYLSDKSQVADKFPLCQIQDASMFIILLSSVIVQCLVALFKIRGSALYAFLGAFAAYYVLEAGSSAFSVREMLSFVLAPILAFAISLLLGLILKAIFSSVKIHMIHLSNIMRLVVILAFVLTAFAFGYNWGGFLSGVGTMMGVNSSIYVVLLVFALSILCFLPSKNIMTDEPSGIFADFSIYSVASTGFSVAITLLWFSSDAATGWIGLIPVPLSVTSLVFMAAVGAEITQKSSLISGEEYLKELIGFFIAPVGSFFLSYVLLYVMGGNPRTNTSEFIVIAVAVVIILALVFLSYQRNQKRQNLAMDRLLYVQQQQIYENSRALNDMEMKVVLSENQALHNAVQQKRQEVMNAALSMVEQKEYLESLKEIVKNMSPDMEKADMEKSINELMSALNHRLSYERDVDSQYFYAQAESVHEDFNAKLAENFPNLTPQERRLATLLRLGFSSKYIATLMNITPKSVEISRYRLRQKLGLDRSDNLVNFIKSI